MPTRAQQQAAKKVTAKRAVDKAAKKVKEAREAAKNLDVTTAESWVADAAGTKLLLPSGHVCLAQNKGLGPFLEAGAIPNSLMDIVLSAINEGKGMSTKNIKDFAADSRKLADIMELVNVVLVASVLEPKIEQVPVWTAQDALDGKCEEDAVGTKSLVKKLPGVLYADMVDFNDKMFVFQWVMGGTRDIERFRQQQTDAVADVSDGEDVQPEAE